MRSASHLICIFIKIPYTIRRTIGSSVRAWSGGELAGKASSHSQIVSNEIRARARGFVISSRRKLPHLIRWNSTNNVDSELEIKHPKEAALKSKKQSLNRGCSANFARLSAKGEGCEPMSNSNPLNFSSEALRSDGRKSGKLHAQATPQVASSAPLLRENSSLDLNPKELTLLDSSHPSSFAVKLVEKLALEHIHSGNVTTHLVINMLLYNQKVSISANKLKELLKVKGIEFDLPITKDNLKNFYGLVGRSTHSGFAGVYVFTHKASKSMYVGSSNLLRRRMEYYFKYLSSEARSPSLHKLPMSRSARKTSLPSAPINKRKRSEGYTEADHEQSVGKLLPILHKEGISSFKLKIFKLDKNLFKPQDALFLEQYMLLNKNYDLNTLTPDASSRGGWRQPEARVVNFGSCKGKSIYVYNLDCTVLYYQAESQISLKRVLGIHTATSNKYLDSNIPYLNYFILLSFPVPNVVFSDVEVKELKNIMDKERRVNYESGTRRSIPVILEIKEGNTFVNPATTTNKLEFNSLTSCITYLHSVGLCIKRDTLSKYIKLGKVFHNFCCKYLDQSDLVISDERERIGLLIEEYKKNRISPATIEKVNKKNKPIIVKSISDNKEHSFLSIMDAIRYFDTKGIKLHRNLLYTYLKKGGIYKGFTFQYVQYPNNDASS